MPCVLAWAVEGYVEWAKHGLGTAGPVEEFKGEYRGEMDTFAEFIEDKCEVGRWLFSTPADLHKAYTEWAELVGERHLSLKKLGSKLRTRGYEQGKDNKSNRIWRGIRPKGAGGTDPSGDPSGGKKSSKSQENAPDAPPWPEGSGHGGASQELQEDIEFGGIYVTDEKSAQQLREELGI
jgi:phage/plasmid-associated DNA primase